MIYKSALKFVHIELSTSVYIAVIFILFSAFTTSATTKTIMGIGDSLTKGSEEKTPSYIVFLRDLLSKKECEFEFIGPNKTEHSMGEYWSCGFAGKNVEYIAERIDSIYKKYPADIVLLQCGHNHFNEEKPVKGMIEAYQKIISILQRENPDVKVFIAKVVESGKLPKYAYIPELNKELKKMVKSYDDKNIVFADISRGFEWNRHTVSDLVHPTPEGALIMAQNWFRVLNNDSIMKNSCKLNPKK